MTTRAEQKKTCRKRRHCYAEWTACFFFLRENKAGEDVICHLWAGAAAEQSDQTTGKNTLKHSAVKLKGERRCRHETWRDVDAFFCYSNIQIMKQARCSSNPLRTRRNGMVQSPRKYVTQIRKHEGERKNVSLCTLHFKVGMLFNAVLYRNRLYRMFYQPTVL